MPLNNKPMTRISAVIITFNEEKNIGRCLESLKNIADDVVVVDSFSTDLTERICQNFQVNFIKHAWEGYSGSKNFGNSQAKYDWILSLDADEALSEDLINSILDLKNKEVMLPASFNRLTNYCGTWIRHSGWYPDVKTRIFNRTNASWKGSIHEQLVFKTYAPVFHLKGDCHHYSYYSIEQHKEQALKFSELGAEALFQNGRRSSILKMIYKPIATFLKAYIINFGFLDGPEGFTIARISAWSSFIRYSILYTMQRSGNSGKTNT
jgi:glycosyltransferase involved in cell wall biosynthesis